MAYISLTSISEAVMILTSGSYEIKFCFKSFCFPTLYSVFGLLTKILTKQMLRGSRESFLECNTCRDGNSFLISATMASQIKWVLYCKIAVDQWQRNLTICYFAKIIAPDFTNISDFISLWMVSTLRRQGTRMLAGLGL